MGWGGIGGAGALCFCTLFRLHDHVIQLVTSVEMLGCCSIHLSDCFCGNIAFTTCCFEFSLEHVLLAKLTMLHGIVVALCHTILGHVLPAKLITLHDIVVLDVDRDKDWTWGGVGAGPFLFYVLTSLNVHMGRLMQSKLELCVCFPFHC